MNSKEFLVSKDGSTVIIEGNKCKLKASKGIAIYPYRHITFRIYFEPVSKASTLYQKVKELLKDEWIYGWDDMDVTTQVDILTQLGFNFHSTETTTNGKEETNQQPAA